MQDLFEVSELKTVQDRWCALGNFFACCLDGTGKRITEMSGCEQDIPKIEAVLDEDQLYYLFERVSESSLEDQIIDDTRYGNFKVGAVSYKLEGKAVLCWLVCYVLREDAYDKCSNALQDISSKTTEETVEECIDLLRVLFGQLINDRYQLVHAREKFRKTR
ncbi:MAG: hypothetical protein J6P60_05930 [Lachnospiraceae bacterium]|nr:hypothetical protein [Lachnospiraceae bacterium]